MSIFKVTLEIHTNEPYRSVDNHIWTIDNDTFQIHDVDIKRVEPKEEPKQDIKKEKKPQKEKKPKTKKLSDIIIAS